MRVRVNTEKAERQIRHLIAQAENAVSTVAEVTKLDSRQTENDFHHAGNTTMRADESVGVTVSGNIVTERATGTEVLFKEFGTGVRYARHPLGNRRGATRGTYGKGRGGDPSGWYFTASGEWEGEFASEVAFTDEMSVYQTEGQPASMSMYNSYKRLDERIPKVLREKMR